MLNNAPTPCISDLIADQAAVQFQQLYPCVFQVKELDIVHVNIVRLFGSQKSKMAAYITITLIVQLLVRG